MIGVMKHMIVILFIFIQLLRIKTVQKLLKKSYCFSSNIVWIFSCILAITNLEPFTCTGAFHHVFCVTRALRTPHRQGVLVQVRSTNDCFVIGYIWFFTRDTCETNISLHKSLIARHIV